MDDILILNERELREAVTLDLAAVDVVERAFAALALGSFHGPAFAPMPPASAGGS